MSLVALQDEEMFEHAGLVCLVLRGPLGCLNGYVQLPAGVGFDALDLDSIAVHGGVTFGGELPKRIGQWVGFDTAHGFDDMRTPRDLAYVRAEVVRLAEQLLDRMT